MRVVDQVAAIMAAAMLASAVAAQSPTAQRRPRPRPAATHIVVRDVSGTPLEGVHLSITGPVRSENTTDASGGLDVMFTDGSYRIRFEREGFVTLERDVTIQKGQPATMDVVLRAAPPAPPPAPAAPPPTPRSSSGASRPSGPTPPPSQVSITTFLDKNFIGREPLKESILGCTQDATTRLLQLRDPIAPHKHDDLDEILYVVAGDGAVRIGEEVTVVTAGSLSVIPRGLPHAIERRGKNPLIVLSTLAGAPCRSAGTE
jgi:mannose-6-phosphate isomerase-like protein (cupin superfamily)